MEYRVTTQFGINNTTVIIEAGLNDLTVPQVAKT